MKLIVEKLVPEAYLPTKANPSDAAHDLYAKEFVCLDPGERAVLNLGIAIQIPENWEAQIRGRSGLAAKGIDVHFGTIDCSYRQELKVIVTNTNKKHYHYEIFPGDRIAQMVISRIWEVELEEGSVSPTKRGGLGSTGR